jgi:hypothetical protein
MDDIVKKHGRRLPHWTSEGAMYHVVFRLADSLPREVVLRIAHQRDEMLADPKLNSHERAHLEYLLSEEIDQFLDAGSGSCLMRDAAVAEIVANAVTHFDTVRYDLHAWCVMPNHVHLVVKPFSGIGLPKIMHGIKSFSANAINRHLGQHGTVWQKESYDHIIRNEEEYFNQLAYVANNPIKARLKDWRWVYRRLPADQPG